MSQFPVKFKLIAVNNFPLQIVSAFYFPSSEEEFEVKIELTCLEIFIKELGSNNCLDEGIMLH
jgi:hypothetical protein